MKAKLKARFLPPTDLQNNYSLLHHLTQGTMSVEEYTRELEKLLIKCDLQEAEEQTIVSGGGNSGLNGSKRVDVMFLFYLLFYAFALHVTC